jgi:hypothetical protein
MRNLSWLPLLHIHVFKIIEDANTDTVAHVESDKYILFLTYFT